MDYPADPGGIFASDVHRRVLSCLPTPNDQQPLDDDPIHGNDLPARLAQAEVPVGDVMAASLVLKDLIEDGDAEQIEGELYRMTPQGFEKLTGPIAEEPEPKAGDELKRAEKVNKDLDKADRQLEAEAREKRRNELREELAALGEEK